MLRGPGEIRIGGMMRSADVGNGIRRLNGDLYVAVRKAGAKFGVGGAIVKWTGDKLDPFRFETVGDLGSEPGYIAEHEGRIVAAGWTGVTPGKAIGEMDGAAPAEGLRRRRRGGRERPRHQ